MDTKKTYIEKFKAGKIRQSALLHIVKDDIRSMLKNELPIYLQISEIEEKYNIEIQRKSYYNWIARNKNKILPQKEEPIKEQPQKKSGLNLFVPKQKKEKNE